MSIPPELIPVAPKPPTPHHVECIVNGNVLLFRCAEITQGGMDKKYQWRIIDDYGEMILTLSNDLPELVTTHPLARHLDDYWQVQCRIEDEHSYHYEDRSKVAEMGIPVIYGWGYGTDFIGQSSDWSHPVLIVHS